MDDDAEEGPRELLPPLPPPLWLLCMLPLLVDGARAGGTGPQGGAGDDDVEMTARTGDSMAGNAALAALVGVGGIGMVAACASCCRAAAGGVVGCTPVTPSSTALLPPAEL